MQMFWNSVYPPATGERDIDTKAPALSSYMYITSMWIIRSVPSRTVDALWSYRSKDNEYSWGLASLILDWGLFYTGFRNANFRCRVDESSSRHGCPARARQPKYVELDKHIFATKMEFNTKYSWLFVSWPASVRRLRFSLTENYLDRVVYFVST